MVARGVGQNRRHTTSPDFSFSQFAIITMEGYFDSPFFVPPDIKGACFWVKINGSVGFWRPAQASGCPILFGAGLG
ncbi:MAG: hypothetical protein D6714_17385 [Bacteroidetes bacterium]|nr:MAG: hypothetical protein D6714_17385 [Bacteroidota bacterium]